MSRAPPPSPAAAPASPPLGSFSDGPLSAIDESEDDQDSIDDDDTSALPWPKRVAIYVVDHPFRVAAAVLSVASLVTVARYWRARK